MIIEKDVIRELIRTRLVMLAVNSKVRQRTFKIPLHLGLGHEAIAVAVTAIKEPQDCLVLSHRNMHYNVANQLDPQKIVQEYLLETSGAGQGQYGSMNLIQPEKGLVYTSSILGNNLCVAAGIAKGNTVLEGSSDTAKSATFVVTGDGAMEEGAFYEALLMAKTAKVPMIVIVENNGWSMYTQIHERRFPINLEKLGSSLSVPVLQLKSDDVVDYAEQLKDLRAKAIEERTPVIVEVLLHTLGDYWTEESPGNPSRIINYHHGLAPKIEQTDDPEVAGSPQDPVSVAFQRIGRSEFEQDIQEILASLQPILADSNH